MFHFSLKNILKTILGCLLFMIMGSAQVHALEITFLEKSMVTGNQITLQDIASITPADVGTALALRKVSPAPQPGKSITLKTSSIKSYLELTTDLSGCSWKGPDKITVKRRGIDINEDRLKNIIAGYLQKNLDKLPPADIRFIPGNMPEPFTLPDGDLSWEVIPSNPAVIGSSSFSIILKINGKTVENKTVRGKLEAWADIVVANTTVKKGSLISQHDISTRHQDISKLHDPFFSKQDIIGLLTKQTLHPGRVIEKRHLQLPPHINKGDRVKIIANKGSLNISAMGIASASGRKGDMIRVRNIQSNKLIYCMIAAPGLVSVNF